MRADLMPQRKPRLTIDTALEVLASAQRRRLLGYLLDETDPPTNRDELAEQMAVRDADRQTVETSLAHHHLPRLDDVGVIEYDHRSGGVRFDETLEDLEPLLVLCEEWESGED